MKPTQDLIPYGPSFDEPVWGISVICPITRDMADLALAMSVLAKTTTASLATPRLAVSVDFGTGQVLDSHVAQNFDAVCQTLRAGGIGIENVQIDWPDDIKGHDIQPLQYAGLAELHGEVWRKTPDLFDPAIGEQIKKGLALSGTESPQRIRFTQNARNAARGTGPV